MITLLSRVTVPLRARRRPSIVAPVCAVIEVRARTVPAKAEPVPIVAELDTCQNRLQAWAPLIRVTDPGTMSELLDWKTQVLS